MVPLFMAGTAQSAYSANLLTNTAKARATAPAGVVNAVESLTDTVDIDVVNKDPEYIVNKSSVDGVTTNGGSGVDAAGDTIIYSIAVKNTGNVTLTDPVLTDAGPVFGGVARTGAYTVPTVPASGDTGTDSVFSIGETWVYNITYTLTLADVNNAALGAGPLAGTVTNTVSIATNDPQGTPAPEDPDEASDPTEDRTLTPITTMTIDKRVAISTGGGAFIAATGSEILIVGDVVRYSYVVRNTGTVTLSNINVQETAFTGTGGTSAIIPGAGPATLAPGASVTITANDYTLTQADIDGLQ
jgi:uncharacterized repeat protein (TIGR01451 family)